MIEVTVRAPDADRLTDAELTALANRVSRLLQGSTGGPVLRIERRQDAARICSETVR